MIIMLNKFCSKISLTKGKRLMELAKSPTITIHNEQPTVDSGLQDNKSYLSPKQKNAQFIQIQYLYSLTQF